ncbi:MAG: hypothetical protein ACOX9E_04320 [Lentisphaeria bacterium]|jgi:hypothetical protein
MTPQTPPSTPVSRLCCKYQSVTAYKYEVILAFRKRFYQPFFSRKADTLTTQTTEKSSAPAFGN